jgi:hypothetical protein
VRKPPAVEGFESVIFEEILHILELVFNGRELES